MMNHATDPGSECSDFCLPLAVIFIYNKRQLGFHLDLTAPLDVPDYGDPSPIVTFLNDDADERPMSQFFIQFIVWKI